MALPWLIPAAISAGSALGGYLTRDRRRPAMEGVNFPTVDFGAQQRAALSEIGTDVANTGRAAGRAMTSRGFGDSSAQYAVGRGLAGQGMSAAAAALASLNQQRMRYLAEKARFDLRKAQGIEDWQAQQPDAWDFLGGGVDMFTSLYPMFNPEAFMPQFPQQAQPQNTSLNHQFPERRIPSLQENISLSNRQQSPSTSRTLGIRPNFRQQSPSTSRTLGIRPNFRPKNYLG